MSRLRGDTGLSIAVWENSPWRSFVRFRDRDEDEGETSTTPTVRPIRDITNARHQEQDDVREIFGRALDVARSKKSFASAASVISTRKDVMRSEARLMAEDNRSWGVPERLKWSNRVGDSSDDLEEYEAEDDYADAEKIAPEAEQVASLRRPTENSAGSISRNSSVRTIASPLSRPRRGTATGNGGVEDADGGSTVEWVASASYSPSASRAPTRLGGELQPQPSFQQRSPQGAQSAGAHPWVDTGAAQSAGGGGGGSPGLGAFGSSAARARAARAAAAGAAPHGGGGGGGMGPKLLHIQASTMPVRHSLEMHSSRKLLSPTGIPPMRRSNSFDGQQTGDAGPGAAVGGSGGGGAGAAAHGTGETGGATALRDPVLAKLFRDRRAATVTGSANGAGTAAAVPTVLHGGSTGIVRRGSGGGGVSLGGGGGELPAQHLQLPAQQLSAPQQRDIAVLRGTVGTRSRRAALLAGEDRRSSGSEGGGGGGVSPALALSPSGRLPEPSGRRLHGAPRPTKTPARAAEAEAVGGSSQAEPRLPRAPGSHSQLAQHSSLEVLRKHIASVPLDFERYGAPPPGSSGSVASEGLGIMGRLKGFFSQQH